MIINSLCVCSTHISTRFLERKCEWTKFLVYPRCKMGTRFLNSLPLPLSHWIERSDITHLTAPSPSLASLLSIHPTHSLLILHSWSKFFSSSLPAYKIMFNFSTFYPKQLHNFILSSFTSLHTHSVPVTLCSLLNVVGHLLFLCLSLESLQPSYSH